MLKDIELHIYKAISLVFDSIGISELRMGQMPLYTYFHCLLFTFIFSWLMTLYIVSKITSLLDASLVLQTSVAFTNVAIIM